MCSLNFMLGKLIKKTPKSALVVQKQPAVAEVMFRCLSFVNVLCFCVSVTKGSRCVVMLGSHVGTRLCFAVTCAHRCSRVHFNVISVLARRAFSPVWLLLRLYLNVLH